MWEDLRGGRRRWFRHHALPQGTTTNVIATVGDPAAERTLVILAHHDAARTSFLFDQGLPRLLHAKAPGLLARMDRWPPVMRLVLLGPLLIALGRKRAGRVLCAGTAAVMADLGTNDSRAGRQRQRDGVRRAGRARARPGGASGRRTACPARLRRCGGGQPGGDRRLRQPPLRRPRPGPHELPVPRHARLAEPDADRGGGVPRDARLPRGLQAAGRRRGGRRGRPSSSAASTSPSPPTAWSRCAPATRPRRWARSTSTWCRPTTTGRRTPPIVSTTRRSPRPRACPAG